MVEGLSQTLTIRRFEAGGWQEVSGEAPAEGLVRMHVNGQELATLMCTPYQLDWLALGFLRSEGIITGLDDVRLVKACPSGACVDVWLRRAEFTPPQRPIITSGCGGGITFADLTGRSQPLASQLRVGPHRLSRLLRLMLETQATRGVHTAGLAAGNTLLAIAEDVGRHNTIDKLWGRCLMEGTDPAGCILMSTGRISSEMLYKAARMGTPVVVSRTTPTSLAIALAQSWCVTLVGYARRDSLTVYTAPERIVENEEEERHADVRRDVEGARYQLQGSDGLPGAVD